MIYSQAPNLDTSTSPSSTTCPSLWLCTLSSSSILPPRICWLHMTPSWNLPSSNQSSSYLSGKVNICLITWSYHRMTCVTKLWIPNQWAVILISFLQTNNVSFLAQFSTKQIVLQSAIWFKVEEWLIEHQTNECNIFFCPVGVLLAILEKLEIISPIYGPDGKPATNAGTVSAGYQNFLVSFPPIFVNLHWKIDSLCETMWQPWRSEVIIVFSLLPSAWKWRTGLRGNGFRCRCPALRFPRDGLRPKLRYGFTRPQRHHAEHIQQLEGTAN